AKGIPVVIEGHFFAQSACRVVFPNLVRIDVTLAPRVHILCPYQPASLRFGTEIHREARLGLGPKADAELRGLLHEPGCDPPIVEGDAHEKFAIPATLDCGPVAVGAVSGRLYVFPVRLRKPDYLFQLFIVLAPACKYLNAQAALIPRTG